MYLRDHDLCEGRIIDRGHRIRALPIVGVLDLASISSAVLLLHFLLKNFSRAGEHLQLPSAVDLAAVTNGEDEDYQRPVVDLVMMR